jgi:glycyl-tRNA synthetase beta subunit
MTDRDLVIAQQALVESRVQEKAAVHFNPAIEVEESLVSLLRNRITKIQDDEDFEQQIKDAVLARLPEADFSQLVMLLNSMQNNSNTSVERILSPFIPRVGERVPLLDTEKEKGQSNMDEKVFEKASKKALDALNELGKLSRVLSNLPNTEPAKPEATGESE